MPPLVAVLIIWKRAVPEKRTHKIMELERTGLWKCKTGRGSNNL